MNQRLFSFLRALRLRRIATALILVAAVSAGSASAQDLAREVLASEYTQLKVSQLQVRCRYGANCPQLIERPPSDGGPFPEVDGSGGNRSVVPRPINPLDPMAGSRDVQRLTKTDISISINAEEIGFLGYPVTFQLNGTRLADGLVRWEGFTPQPDFCVIIETPIGRKMIRIRGVGGNLCARVSQNASPEDDGGLRYYKTLTMANESACNFADPALRDAIELSAAGTAGTGERLSSAAERGRNFVLLRARIFDLQPLEYQLDLYRASLAPVDVNWPLNLDDPPKLFERFKTVDMKALGQKGLDSWNKLWALAMPLAISSDKVDVTGSWTVNVETDQGPASFALWQKGDELSGAYCGFQVGRCRPGHLRIFSGSTYKPNYSVRA